MKPRLSSYGHEVRLRGLGGLFSFSRSGLPENAFLPVDDIGVGGVVFALASDVVGNLGALTRAD